MKHLKAVILDWAGTTLDFGCRAPVEAFRAVFAQEGVPITVEEARAPMGAHKRDHIAAICELTPNYELPSNAAIGGVLQRWSEKHGAYPDKDDVERMFQAFIPVQMGILPNHSALIPVTVETVKQLREWDLKIGSTTGFTRPMMELLIDEAANQGYAPDSSVCATDVPRGRPWPFMCLQNALNLEVPSVQSCVKVDDTIPGIQEGLNSGMWTVGLSASGNEVGLPLKEFEVLSNGERIKLVGKADRRMWKAGAHYVVDTIADLPLIVEKIEKRMEGGERP
jgi:phosphonoacetaldehyde hydrolase